MHPITRPTTDTTLADLFYDNKELSNILTAINVTSVGELLAFTPKMIRVNVLNAHRAYILRRCEQEHYQLRSSLLSLYDFVAGNFGGLPNAPVWILNFITEDGVDFHRPLRVVRVLSSLYPDLRVEEIAEKLRGGHDDAMPADDIDDFEARERFWHHYMTV